MPDIIYNKEQRLAPGVSADGVITDIATGVLGNADTSYTYFPLGLVGFDRFSMQHVITATTLTYEATNDHPDIENQADELISATNDRTFAGAGNWAADGAGASVLVNAGVLQVTVGSADTGAKLASAFFVEMNGVRGMLAGKKYTVTLTIASLSAGTVSVYAGEKLIASGLGNGAAQTITFTAKEFGAKLSVRGTNAAATFTLDNMSVVNFAATWQDITSMLTGGSVSSFTATGNLTEMNPIPWSRIRVKRVTTNATNALKLILTRTSQMMGGL